MKVTGYDTLKDDLQKQLDDTLEELETSSELQQNVVDAMLGNIKTNYETAYTEINTLISESGLSISDTASLAVDSFKDITSAVETLSEAIRSIPQYTPTQVAESVDTSKIVTDKSTGGKSTVNAENAAAQPEDVKNNAGALSPSNKGSQTGKATSISLSSSSLTLKVGASATLSATPKPVNASVDLKWSVKDSKIASVSNGTVKGKKAGTTTVTVKDSKSGASATCTVKVTGKSTKPTTSGSTGNTGNSSSANIWSGIAKDNSLKGNKSLNINQSISDRIAYNGYKTGYESQKQLWKNLKGSGTYTGTASQNVWMLEQLKKVGYSKGGLIDRYIQIDPNSEAAKYVYQNGDNAIITARAGEYILPEDMAKRINPTVQTMETFNDNIRKYASYSNENSNSVVHYDSLITVNGNVDKNVMDDLKKLTKQLVNNRDFVNNMTGKISMNLANDAYTGGAVRKIR